MYTVHLRELDTSGKVSVILTRETTLVTRFAFLLRNPVSILHKSIPSTEPLLARQGSWRDDACSRFIKNASSEAPSEKDYFNPCPVEYIKIPCPLLIFGQSDYLIQGCCYKITYLMANSAEPDQLASSEANWSGSTLFAKAGYIRVQQDKGFKRKAYAYFENEFFPC